ncbi:DUF3027 domain-containing protein [Schaalia naturae]|uniref:DUF3027 domain-containing protein n=1 Tax=Schaalia naturae TaxID=635203 RepID=A0ABW2SID9_9ACTO
MPERPVDTETRSADDASARRAQRARKPRIDAVLDQAVGIARRAAEDAARPGSVGDHIGSRMEQERVLTHFFASRDPGYTGWMWAVTLARVPRSKTATVDEVDLVPGEGALLAPSWVPWEERLRPGDVSRSDVLPYQADDERLEQGFEGTGIRDGDDPDLPIVRELGLGRPRVLSRAGRDEAVERWYRSERGPSEGRRPRATCSTCGFLVKMSGSMRTVFGVCANEWSPDDGSVVSLDHTCGSHSETDVAPGGPEWPVRPSHLNEFLVDAERAD